MSYRPPHSLAANRLSPHVLYPQTAIRTCLECTKPFKSTGPGNRRCQRCKTLLPESMRNEKHKGQRSQASDE